MVTDQASNWINGIYSTVISRDRAGSSENFGDGGLIGMPLDFNARAFSRLAGK
jgi:hypothetical protein